MDFTFDDLAGDTQRYISHFLELTQDEISNELDYLAQTAIADVEILYPDDDEQQKTTIEEINYLKPQLSEMLQSKAREHQKIDEDIIAETKEDLLDVFNREPPVKAVITIVENGDESQINDDLFMPNYVNQLEKRYQAEYRTPARYVSRCELDDVTFHAFYINSNGALSLRFATDEEHLINRLNNKNIIEYTLTDLKSEFESEAEQEKKNNFIKAYKKFQGAIDLTLTMSSFEDTKDRDLFFYLCNLMSENHKHHLELLEKYFKSPKEDLDTRESSTPGITLVVDRVQKGIDDGNITFDKFNKKICESLISKVKSLRENNHDLSEKKHLDNILIQYNFNVLKFKDKMITVRQKIEDSSQSKQGVKK